MQRKSSRGNPNHMPAGSPKGGQFTSYNSTNSIIITNTNDWYDKSTEIRKENENWEKRCIKIENKFQLMSDEQLKKYLISIGINEINFKENCREYANKYIKALKNNKSPKPIKQIDEIVNYRTIWDNANNLFNGDETKSRAHEIQRITNLSESDCLSISEHLFYWVESSNRDDTKYWLNKYIENDHVYNGKIFRGMRFDTKDTSINYFSNLTVGDILKSGDKNLSWTKDQNVACWFAREIDNNKNKNSVILRCVANRTSSYIGQYFEKEEWEVISHSNTKWTVLSKGIYTMSNNTKRIVVDVIEKGENR